MRTGSAWLQATDDVYVIGTVNSRSDPCPHTVHIGLMQGGHCPCGVHHRDIAHRRYLDQKVVVFGTTDNQVGDHVPREVISGDREVIDAVGRVESVSHVGNLSVYAFWTIQYSILNRYVRSSTHDQNGSTKHLLY